MDRALTVRVVWIVLQPLNSSSSTVVVVVCSRTMSLPTSAVDRLVATDDDLTASSKRIFIDGKLFRRGGLPLPSGSNLRLNDSATSWFLRLLVPAAPASSSSPLPPPTGFLLPAPALAARRRPKVAPRCDVISSGDGRWSGQPVHVTASWSAVSPVTGSRSRVSARPSDAKMAAHSTWPWLTAMSRAVRPDLVTWSTSRPRRRNERMISSRPTSLPAAALYVRAVSPVQHNTTSAHDAFHTDEMMVSD